MPGPGFVLQKPTGLPYLVCRKAEEAPSKGVSSMRFVVIGGDAVGMSAASRAKRNAPDLNVVVLEQTQDVSYSACGMPYTIADGRRQLDELVVRRAEVFRQKQGIDLRTGHRAEVIDPRAKQIGGTTLEGRRFELGFDKLLIATGASPRLPPLPGTDLPGGMALKSLEDGRAIQRILSEKPLGRVVILGMGYIALEMCEALRARGLAVDMIKPGPVLLPWLHPDLAAVVRQELEANEVRLHIGRKLQKIESVESNQITVVSEGTELECELVLVATGVAPNSGLAEKAGLQLGPQRSIHVDRTLMTSCPDIYAAGDCADAVHIVTGREVWIPLALRANRAGWAVADNVTGRRVALPGVAGTTVFKVFDLQVARTDLNAAEARDAGFDPVETVIKSRSRAHAHPGASTIHVQMVADRRTGKLLGAQMVGREGAAHRINAPAVALHAEMTVADFIQCDLAYAPPFSPVWVPLLTAANQLYKAL
jgi:NADPH-dependent 2,4-dienoyl-CoA reductase/sulfur reductase-like enzyme